MQTLGDVRAHFWRVIKMAKANDVDLSTALDEGQIDIDQYSDMITGCRGCTQAGACDKALRGSPRLDAAPEYCVNRDVFADLRKG